MGDHVKIHGDGLKDLKKSAKAIADGKVPKQTKSAKKAAAARFEERGAFEEVNVYVTGFGIFDSFTEANPSWLIAKSLPPVLVTNAAHPSRIRIFVHPEPITVDYDVVNQLTSEIYNTTFPIQMWLHIGVADQEEFYRIEKGAHRDGYTIVDEVDKLPDENKQPFYWKSTQEYLETTAAIPDVLARWRGVCPNEDVRISEDAGRYICEYQLYASLAHMSHVGNGKLPWKERTTVAFMHVPKCAAAGVEKLERSREVAIGLIYSLIDSRRSRDGDFDPGDNEEVPG